MSYQITNQRELRKAFWQHHPNLQRRKIKNYSGNGTMHVTDTRCAWCDWLDALSKDGTISQRAGATRHARLALTPKP